MIKIWCDVLLIFHHWKRFLCKYPTYPSHTLNNLHEHPSRTFNEFKSIEVSDLFHSALNPIFCSLDRTLIQCYATQNLLFLRYYIITNFIWHIFGIKSSFVVFGALLFLTSNILVARASSFLRWIETKLFFLSRSWNEADLSQYAFLNTRLRK